MGYDLKIYKLLCRPLLCACRYIYIFFFYKEDYIENQQKRTLTKTIYTVIYKYTIYHQLQNIDTIHNKKVIMTCGQ